MTDMAILIVEKVVEQNGVTVESERVRRLREIAASTEWSARTCKPSGEERPNDVAGITMVIGHNTDVSEDNLVDWCRGQKVRVLVLHTHSWDRQPPGTSPKEGGLTVVKIGSEPLIERLEGFLRAWEPNSEPPLERLLNPPAGVEALAALAILCQGYLVAHFGQAPFAQSAADSEREAVSAALNEMGWQDFVEASPREVPGCLTDESQRDDLRAKVRTTDYWSVVLHDREDTAAFSKRLTAEWGNGNPAGLQVIEGLIEPILQGRGKAGQVAQLLCALAKRLQVSSAW